MRKTFIGLLGASLFTAFVSTADYHALELSYMDTTVSAADDFYNFVNGKWMQQTSIPNDRSRWGSFDELGKRADSMSLAVLDEAMKSGKYAESTDQGKAVMLYESVMDVESRNKQGIAPVKPYLDEILALKNIKALNKYIVKYAPMGENTMFDLGIDADAKNSNKNVVSIGITGLGLPDRDFYLKTDEKSVGIQTKYKQFIEDVFVKFGTEATIAKANAEKIYAFEKALAEPMLTREMRRDPVLQYNPTSIKALSNTLSCFDLEGQLKALKINPDTIIVGQPKFLTAMNDLVKKSDFNTVVAFFAWSTMRGSLGLLSEDLEKLSFSFYGQTLRGVPSQKALKERALGVVNGITGEALGKLYVEKYFPNEAKVVAKQMVEDIIQAYRVRIKNLDWMSAPTKAKALLKLDKLMVKIGFPDKWKDYSKLEIKNYKLGGSYYQNMINASKFMIANNMAKFGKPVDKTEWYMSPQTVNAYYNPSFNEIVFPAAILQPPFFDFRNDPAVNYGGIGAVIGHEISHGFDDQGAQFDENGNLVNWWTEADAAAFAERGKKLIAQFDGFEALPGKFVNGAFTQGENIGDLGGVASAYDGLHLHLMNKKVGLIDGYTQDQRFFLSWATIWRSKIRDAELAMRLMTDPHSPGYFRAIGPLQNHEGFYRAFNVKPGNKMYRAEADRVKIW